MNISNSLPIFLDGTFAEVTSDTQGSRADAFPCYVLRLAVAVFTVPLVPWKSFISNMHSFVAHDKSCATSDNCYSKFSDSL